MLFSTSWSSSSSSSPSASPSPSPQADNQLKDINMLISTPSDVLSSNVELPNRRLHSTCAQLARLPSKGSPVVVYFVVSDVSVATKPSTLIRRIDNNENNTVVVVVVLIGSLLCAAKQTNSIVIKFNCNLLSCPKHVCLSVCPPSLRSPREARAPIGFN